MEVFIKLHLSCALKLLAVLNFFVLHENLLKPQCFALKADADCFRFFLNTILREKKKRDVPWPIGNSEEKLNIVFECRSLVNPSAFLKSDTDTFSHLLKLVFPWMQKFIFVNTECYVEWFYGMVQRQLRSRTLAPNFWSFPMAAFLISQDLLLEVWQATS